MNTTKFKFEFQERQASFKHYIIVWNFESVGELTFKILDGDLHIQNVFIHEDYQGQIGFGNWLRTFENIYVYNVLPESEAYWHRRRAIIVSTVEQPKFLDILFEEEDCVEC